MSVEVTVHARSTRSRRPTGSGWPVAQRVPRLAWYRCAPASGRCAVRRALRRPRRGDIAELRARPPGHYYHTPRELFCGFRERALMHGVAGADAALERAAAARWFPALVAISPYGYRSGLIADADAAPSRRGGHRRRCDRALPARRHRRRGPSIISTRTTTLLARRRSPPTALASRCRRRLQLRPAVVLAGRVLPQPRPAPRPASASRVPGRAAPHRRSGGATSWPPAARRPSRSWPAAPAGCSRWARRATPTTTRPRHSTRPWSARGPARASCWPASAPTAACARRCWCWRRTAALSQAVRRRRARRRLFLPDLLAPGAGRDRRGLRRIEFGGGSHQAKLLRGARLRCLFAALSRLRPRARRRAE